LTILVLALTWLILGQNTSIDSFLESTAAAICSRLPFINALAIEIGALINTSFERPRTPSSSSARRIDSDTLSA